MKTRLLIAALLFVAVLAHATWLRAQGTPPSPPAPPSGVSSVTVPMAPLNFEQKMALGQQVFEKSCDACHQSDALGLPQTYPPLRPRVHRVSVSKRGRQFLIHVVLFGLYGPIQLRGEPSVGLMHEWGSQFSDAEIASVLTYISNRWSDPTERRDFSEVEVGAERAHPMTSDEVWLERENFWKK